MRFLFQQALAKAPCTLVFDEIELLGADSENEVHRRVYTEFLVQLSSPNLLLKVAVILLTNEPWSISKSRLGCCVN